MKVARYPFARVASTSLVLASESQGWTMPLATRTRTGPSPVKTTVSGAGLSFVFAASAVGAERDAMMTVAPNEKRMTRSLRHRCDRAIRSRLPAWIATFALSVAGVCACGRVSDERPAAPADGALADAGADTVADAVVDAAFVDHALASGAAHSCAVIRGRLHCWGDNEWGQIGTGTKGGIIERPTLVGALGAPLALGRIASCARDSDHIACWGGFAPNETGVPTQTTLGPVRVDGTAGMTSLVAGRHHWCGLSTTSVSCWGENRVGQMGVPSPAAAVSPVLIPELRARSIFAGGDNSAAVSVDAAVLAWGTQLTGLLTSRPKTPQKTPAPLPGLERAVDIALGEQHACAVLSDRTVMCWGANDAGQLGRGSRTPYEGTPAAVPGVADARRVVVGTAHSCALTMGGDVFCWGANKNGELGSGDAEDSIPRPVRVPLNSTIEIAAGSLHTCVMNTALAVSCWGFNLGGQVGDGTTLTRRTPVAIPIP